jgi:hypothetical protein
MIESVIYALLPLGLACAIWLAAILSYRRRRGVYGEAARDAVIMAAHPDDCVICAGEYAIEALRGGKSVEVVYLTSGGSASEAERAQKRRTEAIDAWSRVGVGVESLFFIGQPQSEVHSRLEVDEACRSKSVKLLSEILERAPEGAAVFFPAEGEDHHDHRLLRTLTLEALRASGRNDLILFECPEYNAYFALFRAPIRALSYFFSSIPLFDRFGKFPTSITRAETISGNIGMRLPDDPLRLKRKREMLACFESEDSSRLLLFFGYPDCFCRYKPSGRSPVYIALGGDYVSLSLVFVWLLTLSSFGALLYILLRAMLSISSMPFALRMIPAALICVPLVALLSKSLRGSNIKKAASYLVFLASVAISVISALA